MNLKTGTALLVMILGPFAYAEDSSIEKTIEVVEIVALDSNGAPRTGGKKDSYPTIKDFRDGEYSSACYRGSAENAKKLIKGLVEAANGDGDSWASLKKMSVNKRGRISVEVIITDEGGEDSEVFAFSKCK